MSLSAADITDLRTALELLDQHGELAQTDVEADPVAELCGAYRHIGAGGTVARPTRIGPAMLFNTVKGHPGARVAIGVLSSRKRTALLLGTESERLGWLLMVPFNTSSSLPSSRGLPLVRKSCTAPTIRGLICAASSPRPPIPPRTPGRMSRWASCTGKIRKTGDEDVTIHRMCLQGPDTLSVWSLRAAISTCSAPRPRPRQASARIRQHRA